MKVTIYIYKKNNHLVDLLAYPDRTKPPALSVKPLFLISWWKVKGLSCWHVRRPLYSISLAHINTNPAPPQSPFSIFFCSGPSVPSGYRLICVLALPPSGMSSPGEQAEPITNACLSKWLLKEIVGSPFLHCLRGPAYWPLPTTFHPSRTAPCPFGVWAPVGPFGPSP